MGTKIEIFLSNDNKNVNINNPTPEVHNDAKQLQSWSPKYIVVVVISATAMLISLITLTIYLIRTRSANLDTTTVRYNKSTTAQPTEASNQINQLFDYDASHKMPEGIKWISKREWLAQPPSGEMTPLHLPVPYVIITHTSTEDCADQSVCTFHARYIQAFHIESRNWSDIGYNFLVGGDGNIYEGRGFKMQGAHTYGYNAKSIGIAFIGTFNDILPPEKQIFAAKKLIEKGVKENYISADYKLFGARQLQATQGPGLKLYENMQTWDHWSQTL